MVYTTPTMAHSTLPFSPDSEVFHSFQLIWSEIVHEELTYEKAVQYGSKILALVGRVYIAKSEGLLQ